MNFFRFISNIVFTEQNIFCKLWRSGIDVQNETIEMSDSENPNCIYCNSSKVIKHGRTSTGNRRYRCRNCGKTWVPEKSETLRPDISDIVEAYLNGRTCRDLVSIYRSSPLRINQKIREFLAGCPNWEDYIDSYVRKHEPRMVYLVGKTFSCSCNNGSGDNTMFLAMAVDALSTCVLGYQVAELEDRDAWIKLLDRMNCRGILPATFMGSGSLEIEEAVDIVYPYSALKIYYHRAYRDRELSCCLARMPINNKLIADAVRTYNSMDNHNLSKYLISNNDSRLRDYLLDSPEHFIKRLKERIDNKPRTRVEGLTSAFRARFEKFHMLKGDPLPVINGWISKQMLSRLNIGFSRLSIYTQIPSATSFKKYSCGNLPERIKLEEDSPRLRTFVVEIAARSLQVPLFFSKCEMKLDKCSLI